MVLRLSAFTRLLVAALITATICSGFIQNDEELVFATPWQDASLHPLPQPRRDLFPIYTDDDAISNGSRTGFEPHTYQIEIHILEPWTGQLNNMNSHRFKILSRRIQNGLMGSVRILGGDITLHLTSFRRSASGQVVALVDLESFDFEDHGAALKRTVRSTLRSERLGRLGVNKHYLAFRKRRACRPGEFLCERDRTCISESQVCDRFVHCTDGADELDCPCRDEEFVCVADGTCINPIQVCDARQDCTDGADELECLCRANEFTCSNGECIPEYLHCDGRFDCRDRSDEIGCPTTARPTPTPTTPRPTPNIVSESEDHFYSVNQHLRSENTRSVSLGLSVALECNVSLSSPVWYTWSKKDGKLAANADIDDFVLNISEVQAEDAGVYVCTSKNQERSVDLSTLLTVTGVVPRFDETSYLALPTLPRAYFMFNIEISFKPESADGLILYNSQLAGPDEGDFVAFGLVSGYPEFRFSTGTGTAIIRGTQLMEMNQWHTIKLSRNRKEGIMVVNGGAPVVGVSEGSSSVLNLVKLLYLGGVPDFQNVHQQTGMTSGFRGCISRFVIGNTLNTDFVLNAMERMKITSCETCGSNPCYNNGVCQEAYNERGHKCFCPAGFFGELCENAGESCYEGVCGTGQCFNKPGGFKCYCPYGKTGDRCSQNISINEPAFGDESYIAFPTPLARQKFAVDMNVKPEIRVMDQQRPPKDALVDSANVDQRGRGASPCSRSPCQNNAACVEDPASTHGYTCLCPHGYSGQNCQHNPGACNLTQPCMNGGTCVREEHDYICQCHIGYIGHHCENVQQPEDKHLNQGRLYTGPESTD